MKKIESFTGKYRFLSNFWPAEVMLDGVRYASVEHAYQAAKSFDATYREDILLCFKAGDAKKFGDTKKLEKLGLLRTDWRTVNKEIMLDLLRQKFSTLINRQMLLDTGDAELIEGNWWGDTYWGVCNGEGENWLGKLLMQVRAELKKSLDTKPVAV